MSSRLNYPTQSSTQDENDDIDVIQLGRGQHDENADQPSTLGKRKLTSEDKLMEEVHTNGKTIEDIEEILRRVPIHPRIVPAIKSAHALGCDLRIVSDANLLFIETILEHLGIKECFSEINTNPSYNENGRLRILPYHDFRSSSHGCDRCPPNMCKGMIIDRIQALIAKEGKKRFIYLGDGVGDFCPSLKLEEGDYMMPRKNFPVWDLICKNRMLVKAEIHEWTDGEDFEHILLHLIHTILIAEESRSLLLSADGKLHAEAKLHIGRWDQMSPPAKLKINF